MRSFRLICALVLAANLAILPVLAPFAMKHISDTEAAMTPSGDDCKPVKVENCFLACCHVQALAVDGLPIAKPGSLHFAEFSAERLLAIALGPDPPPPRS